MLSEFTKNFMGARRNRAISFAASAWTTGLGVWSDGSHKKKDAQFVTTHRNDSSEGFLAEGLS